MKNKRGFAILTFAFFAISFSLANAAQTKRNLTKAVITEISGYTLTVTKNSSTYTVNAERAVLQNARGKNATIDQFLTGDQINVKGSYDESGNIVARTIKNLFIKETSLTRGNVGSENLSGNAISDLNFISNGIITEEKIKPGTLTNLSIADNANISASKLNLANAITTADIQNGAITSEKLADGITIPTGNFTTLDLGTNTITDGNFTGNWSFNSGTINSGSITTSGTLAANGSGNNYFAGNVGIGTTSPHTGARFQIGTPGGDLGSYPGAYFYTNAGFGRRFRENGTANNVIVYIGYKQAPDASSDNWDIAASSGNLYSFASEGAFKAVGGNNDHHVSGWFQVYSGDDGSNRTLNEQYGVFIATPEKAGTLTINEAYGLYVAAPTTGVNNYGIWNQGTLRQVGNAIFNIILPGTDRSYNIGSSDLKFQDIWLAGDVRLGGSLNTQSILWALDGNGNIGSPSLRPDYVYARTRFVGPYGDATHVAFGLDGATNGIFAAGDGIIGFATSGVAYFGVNGFFGPSSSSGYAFSPDSTFYTTPDLRLLRAAARTLQINANAGDNSANTYGVQAAGSTTADKNGGTLSLSGGTPGSGGLYGSLILQSNGGNVGIGTTNPQSKLHVDGGYLQLDNNSGAPAAGDCDAATEEGRIYWDATNDELYVCSGASGWRKMTTVAP